VGVAWNVTHYGVDHYANASGLLDRLASLDLFVQVQVEHDQLVPLVPMLERSGARILIDHCGRPTSAAGLDQPGFRALLGLAATRRAFVKLSGVVKFSREPFPHDDARPYIDALIDAGHSLIVRWFASPMLDAYRDMVERYPSLWVLEPSFPKHLRDVIRAPSIGTLTSAGNFNAGLELTGAASGFALTSANIAPGALRLPERFERFAAHRRRCRFDTPVTAPSFSSMKKMTP
jgi:hypothetical protein